MGGSPIHRSHPNGIADLHVARLSPVASENSDSCVSMVQPTKDRLRDNVSEPLNRACVGCVLAKRKVSPHLIIVAGVIRKNAPKVIFVEHDHVVRALVPRRPDQAFNKAVLPGRAEGRRPIPNTHRSDASFEHGAERSVIVANEILRRRVPWECFSDLARQPLGRRGAGHRKPQQLPTFAAENKKCKELLKRNRRNHEQINRRNPLHMIAKEGLPRLQWPIPPRYHVDRNRGLGDLDAELEQLAMDLGRAPQRVLKTHSSDQVAHLSGDPRSATRRAGFPSPVASKTLAMPAHDSLGPDDAQGIKNARVATIEPDEQGAVDPTQMQSTARRALPQDVELMPQY